MQRYIVLFNIILFLFALNLKAQHQDIKFEYFTEKDGLSNNGVLSIHEDREGFIWFGTWNGLNKFDGYNFTVFQPDPGNARQTLSHNTISDIAEDKNGLLWLATRGGGLNGPESLPLTCLILRVPIIGMPWRIFMKTVKGISGSVVPED